ncbi:hypothetical protein [Aliiroseovarius sediminis]|uniref:hypothetical protein n=1 Tax=Aliiroseovarius sediminis TaxID=2925839 RepID=UPI001F578F93|nr:hypothetical protein [Aliiroseovarius sediminis]MCI2394348.1 hypothetical protein [Aliiroseovarius sediminis]
MAKIDFSAQFGGRDAAKAVLPHFRALKAACRDIDTPRFPAPKLTFILRVDGSINTYGFSGPNHLDIKENDYVSVDLGIPTRAYSISSVDTAKFITDQLLKSVDFLVELDNPQLSDLAAVALRDSIRDLNKIYLLEIEKL